MMKKKKSIKAFMMKNCILLALLLVTAASARAGDTLRVLFIGNSYTDVNNLPDVVRRLAAAGGDSLYYKASVPGGTSFQQHSVLPATLSLIAQGGWDYVVLQEQSQRPSFNDGQVAAEVYPYAKRLDSLVHRYSPCAKTIFYMTWGRKYGDVSNCAVWPPVCTYLGMDSLLQLRYSIMAEQNNAMISPVAKVWRRLINTTGAPNLYQVDSSHPTPAGTYAAALSFYSLLYRKNPVSNTFNFSLTAAQADMIKAAAKTVVYDSLAYWQRFSSFPLIDSIAYTRTGNTFQFTAVNPRNVMGYSWNFGDGSGASTQTNPTHTYPTNNTYNVCLTLYGSCDTVTVCRKTGTGSVGFADPDLWADVAVFPNPAKDKLQINGLQSKTDYVFCNLTGAVLKQGVLSGPNAWITLPALPAGIYLLKLHAGSGDVKVLKVVRE